MFEVEIKFKITPEQKIHLIKDAEFLSKEEFIDVYYDTETYDLSLKDIWLRTRNNKFLLKIPIHSQNHNLLKLQRNTPKKEIENLGEIINFLKLKNIEKFKNLPETLIHNGYLPLYEYSNIREKYQAGSFIIDFDTALWENHIFETCEIELLAKSEAEIPKALDSIRSFAQSKNLTITPVKARLIEIIKIKNPDHYQKLQNA